MRTRRRLFVLVAALALVGGLLPATALPVAAVPVCNSTDVSNKANFESDTVYELLSDRFADGDASNNNPFGYANSYDPTHTDINRYFGGDWQGVINNIGYLKNMGITAIWITPPYDTWQP